MPEHGLVGCATGPEVTTHAYLVRPIDGRPAVLGNGQTVALVARGRSTARAFHVPAVTAGGTCEGPPGLRPGYHDDDYGACGHDLDAHEITGVCHLAEGCRAGQKPAFRAGSQRPT